MSFICICICIFFSHEYLLPFHLTAFSNINWLLLNGDHLKGVSPRKGSPRVGIEEPLLDDALPETLPRHLAVHLHQATQHLVIRQPFKVYRQDRAGNIDIDIELRLVRGDPTNGTCSMMASSDKAVKVSAASSQV